jgi:hypothetical protein
VQTGDDLLLDVSNLIDAWCERRELKPLAILLPAWLSNNGLTDGWAAVLDALKALRGSDSLRHDEGDVVERSIIAVEHVVYR